MINDFDEHDFEIDQLLPERYLLRYFTCKNCRAVFYLDNNIVLHSAKSIFFTGDKRIFPPKCEEAQKLLNMIEVLD